MATGFDVLPEFFVPADTMRERARRDRVPYDEWARRGLLTATPGNVVDYEYVRQTVHALGGGVRREDDRRRSVERDGSDHAAAGSRTGLTVRRVRQGFASLSAPTKSLETAILVEAAAARWASRCCAGMSGTSRSRRTRRATSSRRRRSSTERIDGVVALVMAIDQMDRHQHAAPPAEYEMHVF